MTKHPCTTALTGFLLLLTAACGSGTGNGSKVLPAEEYARAIATDSTAVIIDVRTPEEYAQGHLDGALLMNVSEEDAFTEAADTLDKSHTYYIYCRSGRRSSKAAIMLLERGLTVVDLKGGYNAWTESGLAHEAGTTVEEAGAASEETDTATEEAHETAR